jgi:hypothetical protein
MGQIQAGESAPLAGEITRGVIRLFGALGLVSVTELTLANGRRADIAALGPDGEIRIVEVKSSVADYRSDQKWPAYEAFCDRFYFAVAASFPREILPERTGLIIADGFGGAVVRAPDPERLAGARRKAMTLRFARLAASRLQVATGMAMDPACRKA